MKPKYFRRKLDVNKLYVIYNICFLVILSFGIYIVDYNQLWRIYHRTMRLKTNNKVNG